MATFESKVSDIFHENPKLSRHLPVVIKKIFQESQSQFKRRLEKEPESNQDSDLLRLFDILYMDYYFNELHDRFMSWVIANYSDRFSESELEEMRAQANSHLGFYEVQQVFPGKGSHIKSIITGEEGFLEDISSSHAFAKWDIFQARCYPLRGNYFATGAVSLFTPSDKAFIVKAIKESMSEYGETEFSEFAKNHWDIFFQIERQIRDQALNKKLYTKYGELQFCEVRFQVNNLRSVLDEIVKHHDFSFVDSKLRRDKKRKRDVRRYQFDWADFTISEEMKSIKSENIVNAFMVSTQQLDEEGNQTGIEFIGNLYIDRYLCRLETRSFEVAEFAVQYFARIFGDALSFKRIIKKKIDLNRQKEIIGQESPKPEQPSELGPEFLQKFGENFYLKMLDEKIPALKNKTPREARKDIELLPLLIDWLKGLENSIERSRNERQLAIPIDKLKKELNLDF